MALTPGANPGRKIVPGDVGSAKRMEKKMEPCDKVFQTSPFPSIFIYNHLEGGTKGHILDTTPLSLLSILHHLHSSNAHGRGSVLLLIRLRMFRTCMQQSSVHRDTLKHAQTQTHSPAQPHSDLRFDRCTRPSLSV